MATVAPFFASCTAVSLPIPVLPPVMRTTLPSMSPMESTLRGAVHDVTVEHEHVHVVAPETRRRFLGRTHDGLVLVEAGVEQHRHARELVESRQEAEVARVRVLGDGLNARRAVL